MPDVLYYVLYLLYLYVYCLVACPHTEESQRLKKKKTESQRVKEKIGEYGSEAAVGLAAALLYTLLALLVYECMRP